MARAGANLSRMVVGLDGSEPAARALEWASSVAAALGAEIIAVHALGAPGAPLHPVPVPLGPEVDEEWLGAVRNTVANQWCELLVRARLPHRALVRPGRPAGVLIEAADEFDAGLVVVGRRGRGGVAELLLGSVSHELAHRCARPVALIS